MMLQTFGIARTETGKAVFIAGAFVIMVPFISWTMTGNRPELKIIIACLIMIFGIGPMSIGNTGIIGWNRGDLLVLISTIGFAIYPSIVGIYATCKDPLLWHVYNS